MRNQCKFGQYYVRSYQNYTQHAIILFAYNIEPIYTTVPRFRGQVQSELYKQMTSYVANQGKYVDLRRVLDDDNKFVDMAHPNADGHRCIYNLLGSIDPCLND